MKYKYIVISLFFCSFFGISTDLSAQKQTLCASAQALLNKDALTIPQVFAAHTPELIGCFQDTLHQAHWFTFTALTSGTFEFVVKSTNLGADYDFSLFTNGCPCDSTTELLACNWIGAVELPPFVETGIASDPTASFGAMDIQAMLEFEPTVNLIAGKTYTLVLDNISNNGVGFEIQFGGTATIGKPLSVVAPKLGAFNAPKLVCSGVPTTFEVGANAKFTHYEWAIPSDAQVTGTNTKKTITFPKNSAGGKIRVIGRNGCFADTASVVVTVSTTPQLVLANPIPICGDSCLDVGAILFSEVSGLSTNIVTYRYYNNASDAFTGNPAPSFAPKFICETQTLWLRAHTAQGCFDTAAVIVQKFANPSAVLTGGGTVCAGDTISLVFTFTGKPPFTCNYTDGTSNFSFTTNIPIKFVPVELNKNTTFSLISFTENSNAPCAKKMLGKIKYTVIGNCACLKKAGTMQKSVLQICGTSIADATPNNDHKLDPGDLIQYIFHSTQTHDLGTVYAIGQTPSFAMQNGMMYDSTYYISTMVGKNDGTGQIDLTDGCLSVAIGQPVVFNRPPTVDFVTDETVCKGNLDLKFTNFKGELPFELVIDDGAMMQTLVGVDAVFIKKYNFTKTTTFRIVSLKDAKGCTNVATDTTTFKLSNPLKINNLEKKCNALNSDYRVRFTIEGGDKSSYMVLGILGGTVTGDVFESNEIPSEEIYEYWITDVNHCDTLKIGGQHTCSCTNIADAGTFDKMPLTFCETAMAEAVHIGGSTSSGTTLGYILHDTPSKNLGKVFGYNTTPTFLKDTLSSNKMYYIAAVAADKDVSGKANLSSPCLQISESQPIMWVSIPTASLTGVDTVCKNSPVLLHFNLKGGT
ncbi:MAG: hypothetical protein RLZZ292_1396, partial [Bacteroidota bacterium]